LPSGKGRRQECRDPGGDNTKLHRSQL
jgi:hypothetical protein